MEKEVIKKTKTEKEETIHSGNIHDEINVIGSLNLDIDDE